MEKKYMFLKRRKLTILASFTLVCIMILSNAASSMSTDLYTSRNDIINKDTSRLSDRSRHSQIIENLIGSKEKRFKDGLFNVVVYTKCGKVEKSEEMGWIRSNRIDVDNNENTGVDGKDIEIRYFISPWVEVQPDIAIGAIFSVTIDRIGEEIKYDNFTSTLDATFGESRAQVGYWSPNVTGNEIPDSVTLTFLVLYYPLQKGMGYKLALIPDYTDGNNEDKEIVIIASYSGSDLERDFSIKFDPAIEAQLEYKATKSEGVWQYGFTRFSESTSTVTTSLSKVNVDEERTTTFVIDKLPKKMSFMFGISPFSQGGGELLYKSDEMFNTKLSIKTDYLDTCKYAVIKNTPREIHAKWDPARFNGFCSVDIKSNGTDFILKDSLDDPNVNLTVNNLESVNLTARWNLSQPGNFTLVKTLGTGIDFHLKMYNWTANMSSEIAAKYFSFSWDLNASGSLAIDTNWDPLATVDLEIRAEDIGLVITADSLKAEDFCLEWVISPLYVDWHGFIVPVSMNVYLFLEGTWYQIWGWW